MNLKKAKQLITQNKKVYDLVASHFSDTRTYLWNDLKPLGKYTKDGDRVLDLGCGNGRLYHLFEKKQVDYVGVDQSRELIKIAKKANPDLKFIISEMTGLPFKDNEFDIIYCIATFHHLPDEKQRLKALKEMKRLIKKNGYVIMTNWNLNAAKTKRKAQLEGWKMEEGDNDYMTPWKNEKGEVLGYRYYHGFADNELKELFKKAGLKLEEQYFTTKGRKGAVVPSITSTGNIISIVRKV